MSDVKRRDFIRVVALAGTAGGLMQLSGAWTTSSARVIQNPPSSEPQHQQADRSADRDAWAIERSTIVVDGLDPSSLDEKYLKMLKAGGVNCWHKSMEDVQSFADAYDFLDGHRSQIVAATSVKEVRQARQDGKVALLFGWQSADILSLTSGSPPLTQLRAYYQLGLRICGIAYNLANAFGGGNLDSQIGLTREGRRLVEEIHGLDMVLDVGGHTGEQTSLDAIEMSGGVPVICSHSNIGALNDNPRCISDRLIEAIAKTGGVIGITSFSDFHVRSRKDVNIRRSPQVGLDKHLDQYDYIRKLVGVEHVGLGPDFIEDRNFDHPDREQQPPEAYSDPPWFYVKGFENISELPNVTQGLIERGWSPAEIRKMLGENWLRVYEKVWGS